MIKIAIASGKGGTGKTTLSTNLTSYISEKYNTKYKNIILTDLDVEEPNSGLFLLGKEIRKDIKYVKVPVWNENACTLCGNCAEVCNFNAITFIGKSVIVFNQLCHSCYACSELCPGGALPMKDSQVGVLTHLEIENNSSKFDFIESRLDIGQESAVPIIAQTIEFVEQNFSRNSFVIFDSPPGTACPMIEVVKDADFVILITEPTPFGLHDLKLAVDAVKQLKKDFGVVINRFGIGNDGVLDYCKQNNIPVLAKIPNNRKIAELYSSGQLIYKAIPEVEQELEKIYNFLII